MLSLFKWSCESKESKKVMHRQVQAVEPAPRWWIPCQPATQFWGNDGWTTVLIFATLGWNSLKLTIDWPLIDHWLTLIDLDWPWDFDYLEGCFSNIQEFFLTGHRPMVRKRHTELRRPLPRQMLATGQARGFEWVLFWYSFQSFPVPNCLRTGMSLSYNYCHYHSIFIMIYYDLLWSIMIYYDLLWSIMIYYDLLWSIMIYWSIYIYIYLN